MPWSPLSIGSVESHRLLVDLHTKELSCYNGIPLQGPEYAVVCPDVSAEVESSVRHLFVDITRCTAVSRQLYASVQRLLNQQELGHAYLFTFEGTGGYSLRVAYSYRVLTVCPLKIVSNGEGTSIRERTSEYQKDQAYMTFDVSSANPSTAEGRF